MRKRTSYALATAVPIMLLATACASTSQSVTAPEKNAGAPADQLSSTGEWIPDDASLNLQPAINAYLTKIVGPTFPTGQGTPGLGGVSIDLQNRTINIAWKGTPGPATQTLIGSPPAEMRVVLTQSPYTLSELTSATSRVVASGPPSWSALSPSPQATGLTATVSPPAGGQNDAWKKSTEAALTAKAGVPVTAAIGPESTSGIGRVSLAGPVPTGPRWKASFPYGGGAVIFSPVVNKNQCTTAFVGKVFGRFNSITAGHCGDGPFVNGQGISYAKLVSRSSHLDTELLEVAAPSIAPFVYDGTYQGEKQRTVADAAFVFKGDYVCSGGGMSGQHCNVKVNSTGTALKLADQPEVTLGNAEIQNIENQPVGVGGDSGGPVWMFADDSHTKVLALGSMVSVSLKQLPPEVCTKYTPPQAEYGYCSATGYFAPISQTMSEYQFAIAKG